MNDDYKKIIEETNSKIEEVKKALKRDFDLKQAKSKEIYDYFFALRGLSRDISWLIGDKSVSNFFNSVKNVSEENELSKAILEYSKNIKELNELNSEVDEELTASRDEVKGRSSHAKETDDKITKKKEEINNLNTELASNKTKLDDLRAKLASNTDSSLVDTINNDIKNQEKIVGELEAKVNTANDEIKNLNEEKNNIRLGSKTSTPGFIPRTKTQIDVKLDPNGDIGKKIAEVKNLIDKANKILNFQIDYERDGLITTQTYRHNLIQIQNKIKNAIGASVFEQLLANKGNTSNIEFANGMYEYAKQNNELTNDIMDKLNEKIVSSDRYYRNTSQQAKIIKNEIKRQEQRITSLEQNKAKLEKELEQAIKDRNNNKNPQLKEYYDNRIEEIKFEIKEIDGKIAKYKELIDKYKEALKDIFYGKGRGKNKQKTPESAKSNPDDQILPPSVNPTSERPTPEHPGAVKKPKIKKNNPKLTWKTALATAVGIGIGTTVALVAGPLGVTIMTVAGTIGNIFVNKKRRKLAEMNALGGQTPITAVIEPKKGIKGAIQKLKNYFNSEEGLRDMSWLITSAIISGNVVNVVKPYLEPTTVAPSPSPSPEPPGPSETPIDKALSTTPDSTPLDGIKLGNQVEGYNVSTGHTNAANAVYDYGSTSLNSQLVNGNSIFNRFAIITPEGNIGPIIETQGMSLPEVCAQYGVDAGRVAVDVARSDGASQAWVSIADLMEGVGPTL